MKPKNINYVVKKKFKPINVLSINNLDNSKTK